MEEGSPNISHSLFLFFKPSGNDFTEPLEPPRGLWKRESHFLGSRHGYRTQVGAQNPPVRPSVTSSYSRSCTHGLGWNGFLTRLLPRGLGQEAAVLSWGYFLAG